MPPHSAPSAPQVADLPAFPPANSLANEGDLVARIIKDGKVSTDVLAGLENKGNAELSATANFIAGKFEFEHGSVFQARLYFDNALRFQPDNSTILVYYAALLLSVGEAGKAEISLSSLASNDASDRSVRLPGPSVVYAGWRKSRGVANYPVLAVSVRHRLQVTSRRVPPSGT